MSKKKMKKRIKDLEAALKVMTDADISAEEESDELLAQIVAALIAYVGEEHLHDLIAEQTPNSQFPADELLAKILSPYPLFRGIKVEDE